MIFTKESQPKHDRTPNLKSVWTQRRLDIERRRIGIVAALREEAADLSLPEAYVVLTGRIPKKVDQARNFLVCQWGVIAPETRKGIIQRLWVAAGMNPPKPGRRAADG